MHLPHTKNSGFLFTKASRYCNLSCLLVRSFISVICSSCGPNISNTVETDARLSVPVDHQYEMACSESNGHMNDDVT